MVKDKATPQYFKPRPVPYALEDKVAAELSRLEREGVLKKVESSEWATPIVPVIKPNGTVRICGDLKLTLNQYLDVLEYTQCPHQKSCLPSSMAETSLRS